MSARRVVKCLLILAVFVGSLQAELIVYDGFDYPAGSLGGNEGGSGWDPGSAWSGGQNVASPGLEYPYLPTVGNTAVAADDASYRSMPAGFDALNNTTWISFLCQDLETPEWCGVSTYNDGDESLFIGKPGNSRNLWGIHMYNVLGDAGAGTGAEDSQTSISERVFFVVRIVNGSSDARITAWINPDLDREPSDGSAFYDSEAAGHRAGRVPFNRIRIDGPGEAMFFDELRIGEAYADMAGASNQERASLLWPVEADPDVSPTPVLAWSPGIYAGEHDVYLGVSWDDVNTATIDDSSYQGRQEATIYSPDQLTLGQTHYWRIDEVNATPDQAVYKGNVWSFTVEPVAFAVPIGRVGAAASSVSDGQEPNNVVNGAGLNENDEHTILQEHMWLADDTDPTPSIVFTFAQVEKLDRTRVWNHNTQTEGILGFGVKEALIETSLDGETWSEFGTVTLAQASGSNNYRGDEVDLAGMVAKYVKLTALSNYSMISLPQKGLAEVRFYAVPMCARRESPASGSAGLDPRVALSWRSGREAVRHEVLLGTDPEALSTVATLDVAEYLASLDLDSTVYWRVDEINDDADPAVWEGGLWTLETAEYLTVDDMDRYKSEDGSYVWETWTDGFEDDTNGALLGHGGDDMETDNVYDGKSLPYYYGQGGAARSEASRAIGRDWGAHGIVSLSLMFYGAPSNVPGQMILKVDGQTIATYPVASDLTLPQWQAWTVDLPAEAQGDVQSLAIAIEGGSGLVLIDAIRLYARPGETITPELPDPG